MVEDGKESLAASVARLHCAASEHSQEAQKLRQAADALIGWIEKHVGDNVPLPLGCMAYPNEFVRKADSEGGALHLKRGAQYTRWELFKFAKLIDEGFLDLLEQQIEKETSVLGGAVTKIRSFLIAR